MEPITYANGSTLEDPAISYGIVFSNFMSQGVFTFEGGTDRLIGLIKQDLLKNGVDLRIRCEVERINVRRGRVEGLTVNGRTIRARSIVSNANLKSTIFRLAGEEHFDPVVRRPGPGRAAQQFQLPGLHGAEAGRSSWTRVAATCCSARKPRCSAPKRC